jgi:Ca2+-binding RTX toxin-like protein
MIRLYFRFVWLAIVLLILISAFSALATANIVPENGIDDISPQPITVNDLKPPECAGLNLQNIIDSDNGGPGNDLILGSPNADVIGGGDGDDCIIGGDGNDTLTGDDGDDVLLGGNGDDTLTGGAGSGDACYGESGVDIMSQCETEVQ